MIAPPDLEMNRFKVPLHEQHLVDGTGRFRTLRMVDLDRSGGAYALAWLWAPLGFTQDQWRQGAPWKLPLIAELQAEILGPLDLKRDRNGFMRDYAGRIVNRPELLEVSIRGKRLAVYNSMTVLRVAIETDGDMHWLTQQLRNDVELAQAAQAAVAPGGRVANQRNKKTPPAFLGMLQPYLEEIKERVDVYSCTWNHHNARLLLVPKMHLGDQVMRPVYVYVNNYRKMVKQHLDNDATGIEEWGDALKHLVGAAGVVIRQRQEGPDDNVIIRIPEIVVEP